MPPPTPSGFGPPPSFFDLTVNPAKTGGPLDMGESRMFSEGIESFTNNPSYRSPFQYPQQQQQFQYGYDDDSMADGGDDGEQEISCILPEFLYLGPEIVTAEQVQELERLGVKRVLNMARECEDLLIVNHPTIEYHKVGVLDNIEADVSAGLLEAVDIIAASADSPIYVHCKAGKSRSVTATIAYLITQLQWSLNKAYNHVLAQRPCMCPNIGFVTELMRMEERILGNDRAGGLVRAGSLNSILSLSTAGSGAGHNQHHHQHHSLQHHHSLSMGGSPKVLSTKASVNSFAMMSPLHHGGI
ncbi:phosphatases II [Linnemannia elongata AG-77]|uniref:protein-tyrosine-phosphatase n=1 Tax=Linnemannia elongata AG-77 TaxID=1314771 RepID=A0A197K4D3_9FUNG|nr:phosphatases II [Linnemannia elongata AG-77]